jgi:hypothetical protein
MFIGSVAGRLLLQFGALVGKLARHLRRIPLGKVRQRMLYAPRP